MKKVLAGILTLLMCLGSAVSCFADEITFSDVDKTSELGQSIYKLAEAGVINGYEDGTFRANDSLTRAELCKMVNLVFKYTETAENVFTDISADDWYYNQVLIAIKQGYIKGFEDSTFRGDEKVSREQVCVILDRIVNKPATTEITISDEVSDWALSSVKNIISLGYMSLENDNTFRATQNITRGELAMPLKSFVGTQEATTPTTPTNPGIISGGGSGSSGNKKNNSGSSSSGGGSSSGGSSNSGGGSGSSNNDPAPTEPTEEQKAESKKICESLKSASDEYTELKNLNVIKMDEKGTKIMEEYVLKDIEATLAAADKGTLVTSEYVRTTYADDIEEIKKIINGMSSDEKKNFKEQFLKMNTSTLGTLAKYFDINTSYLDEETEE